jgi:hypothetical protein
MFQSPALQFDAVIAQVKALTQQQIASEAKRLHGEIMRTDPRPLNFVRHVDAVKDGPEESVKLGGVIVYDYNRLDIVAKRALEILRDISPVGRGRDPHPGLYRDSHRLFIDGHAVDNLSAWQPGQEISITNTVIYSPIIELGGKGGKKFKIDGGGRVYFRAAQILRRDPDVKGAADIQMTFRAVFGGTQVNQLSQGATPIKRGSSGRFVERGGTRAHNVKEVRWPTITINPAGSFMTRAGLN